MTREEVKGVGDTGSSIVDVRRDTRDTDEDEGTFYVDASRYLRVTHEAALLHAGEVLARYRMR